MTVPRLEIDLDKIRHNARTLVDRLGLRGISVTGVTKAVLGSTDIAQAMLDAGVTDLGDSRIENIEAMRGAGSLVPLALVRTPMLSQARRVVANADVSFNTEIDVLRRLSLEARKQNKMHAVVLMVELGDLREGIMPIDLEGVVHETLGLPNIVLKGIGTNLACRSGSSPDNTNMEELSRLATSIETKFGISLETVSGGNSANLDWAFSGANVGRINNLRLGESILLGCETLHRKAIDGLHTDAITLVAEVIESKFKPTQPWGKLAQAAFGSGLVSRNHGGIVQSILAVGIQDVDPHGLRPPKGTEIIGCSSDHLITRSINGSAPVGAELTFQVNYSALVRAMTSPFVTKSVRPADSASNSPQKRTAAVKGA